MATLPEDVSDDLRLVIDELESAIADIESRLESTRAERDEAKARQVELEIENAGLRREFGVARDRQAAGAEILGSIANTSGDAESSLYRIAETTARLFGAPSVTIRLVEGSEWGRSISFGPSAKRIGAEVPAEQRRLGSRNMPGAVFRENRQIHIPDLDNVDPSMADWPVMTARAEGTRTVAGTPLRHEGKAIGALVVFRDRLAPFTDEELSLLQSFADQAVIAIENAKLFNETRQSLARQTATSEILRVISQSPTDTQPVFEAIVLAAVRLLRCDMSFVMLCDPLVYWVAAAARPDGLFDDLTLIKVKEPIDPSANFPSRTIVEKQALYLPDWSLIDLPEHERHIHETVGLNSALYLPLLREGECIGLLTLGGKQANIFGESEIALAESFRDQALIAIENTRLFNETQEALERQTATSEVLQVISGSMADAQPVFERILDSIERLFVFKTTAIFLAPGDSLLHLAARRGIDVELLDALYPMPMEQTAGHHVIRERKQLYFHDVINGEDAPISLRRVGEATGNFSCVITPLFWQAQSIGTIAVTREPNMTFSANELHLLQTFADQAVIAIENARLFNETKEALERQTATADILKVIAGSPSDTTPVFDAIATSANRLLGGFSAAVFRFLEGSVHLAAFTPVNPAADAALRPDFPKPVDEFEPFELAQQGKPFPIQDTEEIPFAPIREIARLHGFRSMLFVPLMNGGVPIGIISVTRREPGAFSPNHTQLLQTFADQAVIAIENTRLFNETQEALERQTATADILKVIASSPDDVQPVFDAIATSSKQLIGAFSATVFRFVDGIVNLAAYTSINPAADEFLKASFPRPAAGLPFFELAKGGEVVQEADSETNPDAGMRAIAQARGFRSSLFSPLMNKGTPIGLIVVTRKEPGTFAAHHVQLVQTFADQAVIAIENVRLFNETQEALERQTATADILRVIASSPDDVQPVFEAIAERSNRLIDGLSTAVYSIVDDTQHLMAFTRSSPEADAALQAAFPRPLSENTIGDQIRRGEIVQIPDMELTAEWQLPAFRKMALLRGFRAVLFVPLLRDGTVIGLISVTRKEPGAFAAHHVQLLQTFADQAVIAIGNVRLFDEVQAKTRDLTESLQQQTATSDVLKVISRSAFDLDTVMNTLTRSASELCGADMSGLFLREGDRLVTRGVSDIDKTREELVRRTPVELNDQTYLGRAVLTGLVTNLGDVDSDPSNSRMLTFQKTFGYRSLMLVPLMREGRGVGVFALCSNRAEAFSQRQIELVQTFADQAVIAIENVRLFDEVQAKTRDLTEALTYQTGSSNILSVIASSPTDVTPVLNAIVESASKLCEAYDAVVLLKDGDDLRFSAHHGPIPINIEKWPINRNWASGRAFLDQEPVHVRDLLSDEGAEFPGGRELSRHAGIGVRTLLSVPLLRENESVGAILLRRTELHPFSDKQIALLQTFADQAVIAIGNVRLFDEVQAKTRDLTEALTYQTGSSNILKVIASSPTDVGPVLEAIVETACELCEAYDASVVLEQSGDLLVSAHHGPIPINQKRWTKNRQSVSGRSMANRLPVHVRDVLSDEGSEFPTGQQMSRSDGCRTMLSVPLLREGESIGAIVLRRSEVNPFSEKQIALLQTFADQAVIAIGNVRLFDEVQARTRDLSESLQQQTATADVLKVISRSAFDLQPVLDVIVETSRELCGCDASTIFLLRDRKFHVTAVSGALPTHLEFLRSNPSSIDQPGSILARVYREKRTLHYPNVADDPELRQGMTGLGGPRALLTVPLMRDNEVIGGITLRQSHLKPFTDRQIEAIETFADQAVIAISNVGLFEQVQERTRELSQSLDELRTAQDRLVQTEKLASLGQLTAGIAHEIKNPLNFVNNFSALSAELTDELNDLLKSADLTDSIRVEVDELTGLLKDNLEKVVQHGKRADSIVKNMLLHSREGSGDHRPADINALLDESLNLAYHGARAEKREFNVTLQRDFDQTAGDIEVFPQEITRVFLNLISNGFYAVTKRRAENGNSGFEPLLVASTRNLGDTVEIRIRDNGTGIPEEVREKMFNPFFTTKPAGEGTGLGLSMSHDIIVKQHGGRIDVATEPGQFTEFTIMLPRKSNQTSNQTNKIGEQS
jgi:GAF domain-containing protein